MKKVIVLLSGGIDSAFAAYLLKERGYFVKGLSLLIYDNIPSKNDLKNMEIIRKILGIDIEFLDVKKPFNSEVIRYFINTYKNGRTPNPCAVCNPLIKFKFAYEKMKEYGFDHISSGHYAGVGMYGEFLTLKAAYDIKKTQEYFLARLPAEYLKSLVFPLGNVTKDGIKQRAHEIFKGIEAHSESQDVCFLKHTTHYDYMKSNGITLEGRMLYKNRVVLERINLLKFTRGQRRGIEYAAGKRVYVKHIDVKNRVVVLGEKQELYVSSFYLKEPLFYVPYEAVKRCEVKVRYSKKSVPCVIKKEKENIIVILKKPLLTVSPGQLAVLYDGIYVLGSGWIDI